MLELNLPVRWEALKQVSAERSVDPITIVEKVEDASGHIDELLTTVERSKIGQFSVIFGDSGSGKTTFVSTLPKFFDGVSVIEFGKERKLSELCQFISKNHVANSKLARIVLISGRDNPKEADLAILEDLFSDLVDMLRTEVGRVLILWSVTREAAAEKIAKEAWTAGGNSVCNSITKGLYRFRGLQKSKFPAVADNTSTSIFGDGLAAFGIDATIANDLT